MSKLPDFADEAISFQPREYPSHLRAMVERAWSGDAHAELLSRSRTQQAEVEIMERLILRLTRVQLDALGPLTADSQAPRKLRDAVDAQYHRWLDATLRAFEQTGFLTRGADGEYVAEPAESPQAVWEEWAVRKDVWAGSAELGSHAALVEATLRALPQILAGQRAATDVLFRDSALDWVEGIYRGNPRADYFNLLLADGVTAFAHERLRDDQSAGRVGPSLRILEVGAGTGASSAAILQRLAACNLSIAEYCYTDLSKAFLLHAQEKFAPAHPYLRGALLDITQPITPQGFVPGSYDVVVAANVLHATPSIRRTLRNVKSLLRHNGVLLLNEMSNSGGMFAHLTFGLTRGWWLYEDQALRLPGCPALSPDSWSRALRGEGFRGVHLPAEHAHDLGLQIIAAESDGAVRVHRTAPNRLAREQTVAAPGETASLRAQPTTVASNFAIDDRSLERRVEQVVKEKLCQSLRMDSAAVRIDESFADYGVDSILGIRVVQEINRALGIRLDSTSLFDHSNVSRLTAHIVSAYARELREGMVVSTASPPSVTEPANSPTASSVAAPSTTVTVSSFTNDEARPAAVAVIGMSGVFARSRSLQELWAHLAAGNDLVDEYNTRAEPRAQVDYVDARRIHGGFLDGIDEFDPLFFNISGQEATFMDPQQRVFLQESWRALEDAGYAGRMLAGRRCGVYVGASSGDYTRLFDSDAPPQALWGNLSSVVASRISYYLDLQGPAVVVDTACSSSLVALHLACQSLKSGEVDYALAGGVFILTTPEYYQSLIRAGMMSERGRCYTFDARADGFVPGEGAGVVVLKRLEQAVADGDHIHGVIRATGINQDGTTNGITAPSAVSQERLERQVYAAAGLSAAHIQMVEAHGTGTILGDPIEHAALARTFRHYTNDRNYCALGSIKTVLGHTQGAAGVAGLIKVLLSLQHRQIPPSRNFEAANPNIDFASSPFYVNTTLRDWPAPQDTTGRTLPRRAVVSSFGVSGTNGHVVVEEAPARRMRSVQAPSYLFVLSARGETQLREQVTRLVAHCRDYAGFDCGNASYTLLAGRKHLAVRLSCVAGSTDELIERLSGWLANGSAPQVYSARIDDQRRHEQPGLKDYLNECMEACRASVEPGQYRVRLSALAELFMQGLDIPFERLYAGGEYGRVPLPTYPFARERYWVAPARAAVTAGVPAQVDDEDDVSFKAADEGSLLLRPYWQEQRLWGNAAGLEHAAVVLCGLGTELATQLRAEFPGAQCMAIESDEIAIEQCAQAGALGVLEVAKELLASLQHERKLLQVVICEEVEEGLGDSLAGLLKSARMENPALVGQVISVDEPLPARRLAQLLREAGGCDATHLRYARGRRWIRRLGEVATAETERLPWRYGGVYLISGGAGELGLIFAREIIEALDGECTLVLVGRAQLTSAKHARLEELRRLGAMVEYRAVDVGDRTAVQRLVAEVVQEQGGLHGILHAAGLNRDNYLLRKSGTEFAAVLASKVAGLVHLDEASRGCELDLFVGFGSITGVLGNEGQADYAAANAFMDGYLRHRQAQVRRRERRGRSLSIDWPLWMQGGMQVDAARQQWNRERHGLSAMDTATGLQMFYRALASGEGQVVVLHGAVARLRRRWLTSVAKPVIPLLAPAEEAKVAPVDAVAIPDTTVLRPHVLQKLQVLFAKTVALPVEKIAANEPLESYGIDSLMITQLNVQFATVFGELSKTLLYEYQTLGALAEYFASTHTQACARWCGVTAAARITSAAKISPPLLESVRTSRALPTRSAAAPYVREPIAIIGISGRYPQAKDLDALWQNLCAGVDAITEIPAERWSVDALFEADRDSAVARGRYYSKWGGFLDGFADFDALFFGISPREAYDMDPQERLFIESCWTTLEDAGYTRERLKLQHGGRVGVYAGITKTGFELHGPRLWSQGESVHLHTSFGSVANRISYLLNLSGPSLPIDTMCSASLTAIHVACEQLYRQECELALAGGVNLYLHPANYISLCAQRMLSAEGRCKSFGAGGDGFVPGEGVGTVLLKPLSAAQRDGDVIHALIRGSSINHGGKTNGYTVPNPTAQGELIRAALGRAGINARQVSYIEAHGTGTALGDPIEIAGLKQAFEVDTRDRGFCALGSVKSNIGHLEAAAGIAGLSKLVLQLKYGQLVPSLHAHQVNPNIDLEQTPFVLQRELTEWTRPVIEGREYPRLAGVSSFGAGGANAHVLVEEYQALPRASARAGQPALLVLSAKQERPLQQQAQNLLTALKSGRFREEDLADIAYTLQIGREAMEERLGFVAASLAEAIEKLQAFVSGNTDEVLDLYRGQVKRNKEALSIFESDDLGTTLGNWMGRAQYGKVLQLWVRGGAVDWSALHGEASLQTVSLPTYPFERERYWLPDSITMSNEVAAGESVLHPLLHRNTSDLLATRFTSTFSGDEFFLADHQVNGVRVLPAVAYLEMARAAVQRSLGPDGATQHIVLTQIAWMRPLVVSGAAQEVHIGLYPLDEDRIAFEILTDAADAEPTLHCEGVARLTAAASPEIVDVRSWQPTATNENFYERYAALGIRYGERQRALMSLHADRGEIWAHLCLPQSMEHTLDHYVLHPSLLDSALQATIALWRDGADGKSGARPPLPFALDELEVFASCPREARAWIRPAAAHREQANPSLAGLSKLDIDLCDESGRVCIRLKGYTARLQTEATTDTLLFVPRWSAVPQDVPVASDVDREVVLCGWNAEVAASLQRATGVSCEALDASGNRAERYATYTQALLARLRNRMGGERLRPKLIQAVVAAEASELQGLSGLFKSAALENPQVIGQMVIVPAGSDAMQLRAALEKMPLLHDLASERGVRTWLELPEVSRPAKPWKAGGVYLITGGAGGLGGIVATEIAQHTEQARLVLTGRSPVSASIEALLESLRSHGAIAEYRAVDVADRAAVERLIAAIESEHGTLHGIVHSAGVIRDSFILKKSDAELSAVLSPKVSGVVHLDEATRHLPLDFFVLFSSAAGVLGNVGQADYAAANGFMDGYASYRNSLARRGERSGRAVAIDWPLWAEGGMRIEAAQQAAMRTQYGLTPLATAAGMDAFYRALASGEEQVLVLAGVASRLRDALPTFDRLVLPQRLAPTTNAQPDGNALYEKALAYCKRLVADVLKLPVQRLDADASLDTYGIDSIIVMELTRQLERSFGPLSKTLFFEYQNLQDLVRYFLRAYPQQLQELVGSKHETAAIVDAKQPATISVKTESLLERPTAGRVPARLRRFGVAAQATARTVSSDSDIAIIGVAGRYPQSPDLETFWANLRDGRDCITEIPGQRWDSPGEARRAAGATERTYCRWGGFLDGVDEFDPLFFNISPREAMIIDPQERLFLQCAFATLEDAGYTRAALREASGGRVGVYVGVMYEEYPFFGVQAQLAGQAVAVTGSPASIANRVSYVCDFHGPSLAVDSMCSSSLTALHLACESIKRGECALALAGGVNVSIHPNKYLLLQLGQFSSTNGRCASFGAGGDGYVPGEGVGAVLLKSKAQAIADGDRIYAVIRGSSVNHGGKTNGYTVPNPNAQGDLIAAALRYAAVEPSWISYVEAHGTGTSLGDPIEIAGLNQAFGALPPQSCAIGSVKSNIGHCESAAGIAGLTKVLLQMQHGQLVPSLHSSQLNPNIDFERAPFAVVQELSEWRRPMRQIDGRTTEISRIAGLSSFGAGGSNAHIVIEEYREPQRPASNLTAPCCIVLSARVEEQLQERARQLLRTLESERYSDVDLADIAYTLQVGREAMEMRLGMLVYDVSDLKAKLRGYLDGRAAALEDVYVGQPKLHKAALAAFAHDDDFAGTLAQWLAAGKHTKLLQVWVNGVEVDWRRLYAGVTPRRVGLPTYPFARKSYWVEVPKHAQPHAGPVAPSSEAHPVVLTRSWKASAPNTRSIPASGAIVLLATPVTAVLAPVFERRFPQCSVVVVAHAPAASTPAGLAMDFHDGAFAGTLYRALKQRLQQRQLYAVIDTCAYDSSYESSTQIELGKLRFLQQLIEHERAQGFALLQLTQGLSDCGGSLPTLQGARAAGLYRMLGAEYTRIRARVVDSDLSLDAPDALVEQVAGELLHDAVGEPTECCYRQGARYVPMLESVAPPESSAHNYGSDHVVVITGGTRGIGAALAEHVVSRGARRLVLLGRDSLPDSSMWSQAASVNDATSGKLRRLQALLDRGVELRYSNVSLTDADAIEKLIASVTAQWGPITDVFHCAGMLGSDPAFIKKRAEDMTRVVEPKITGLATLHAAVRTQPLRRFVVFSSVSSIAPALAAGQGDYALANAYMDAYVRHHAAAGCAYLKSVQWPLWSEVGMGADSTVSPAYLRSGLGSLRTADALSLLDKVLQLPHAVSLPCRPEGKLNIEGLLAATWEPITPRAISQSPQRPASQGDVAASAPARPQIERWLTDVLVSELKLCEQDVDIDKSFADYGVDSVLIVQIVNALQKQVSRKLDPALLFEHDSLTALIDYFEREPQGVSVVARIPSTEPAMPNAESVGETLPPGVEKATDTRVLLQTSPRHDDDIAVIGMACRLPGAPNKDAYWDLLVQGRSALRRVPPRRWSHAKQRSVHGGWLDDIEMFDAAFFGLKEDDAAVMDPQARVLLEETLAAICDAGYRHDELSGRRIGVYIGGRAHIDEARMGVILSASNPILGLGQNYLATNLSRFFNFTGPSLVLDTACSSGLTGMACAIDALKAGSVEMALVGAASLLLTPYAHDLFAARNILNEKGEFHIFDRNASGEVLGEGAGVVMLKRLADARRDGDRVYAVVKAIAINNDGQTLGPGSPNLRTQRQVIGEGLRLSGKRPQEVGYIEVNGGGSLIVDSVEIKALADVYGLSDRTLGQCHLGSIKPNVGHLLLSSGMAGFIRCVLSVHRRQIPPFLSALEPFEHFDFGNSRIAFNRETLDWQVPTGGSRIAAQNSFADGGTNCHAVVEEFVSDVYQPTRASLPLPPLQRTRYPLAPVSRPAAASVVAFPHTQGTPTAQPQIAPSAPASLQNFWGEFHAKHV